MGLYAKYVLPRLIELAMRNPDLSRLRARWVPQAHGIVLEVGIGSGLNLPFYSPTVDRIYGVDPSTELQRLATERASAAPFPVDLIARSAEGPLPLPDGSIDTAVITWTLCSIPNPVRALEEVRRILNPRGSLIFIEHGRAPVKSVAAWQDRLTPVWKSISGGCHLNRAIDTIITHAGFHISELDTCYLPGPRPVNYTYQGIAVPKGE